MYLHKGTEKIEVTISQRGRWYAKRLEPDGSAAYVAQGIDVTQLERQRPMRQHPHKWHLKATDFEPDDCGECFWHKRPCGKVV